MQSGYKLQDNTKSCSTSYGRRLSYPSACKAFSPLRQENHNLISAFFQHRYGNSDV